MRYALISLVMIAACAGCGVQHSTATALPLTPSTAALPLNVNGTDMLAESPGVSPTPGGAKELPEYLEIPCWQVPVSRSQLPQVFQGWSRYVNAEYCFTFVYPSDWVLVTSQHFVGLSKGTILLVIGFRRETENIAIQRTGVGAGEIQTDGKIVFLGREVSKEILVYEDRIHEVLYQYGTEVVVGDLVFAISGGNYDVNYDLAVLEDETLTTFDKIVESFQRISPKK